VIDRAARKRDLFREVNERIRDVSRKFDYASGSYEFFCECTRPDCLLRVELPGDAYDEIVAEAHQYVVAEGHADVVEALAAA
jgi:hypothetical protein